MSITINRTIVTNNRVNGTSISSELVNGTKVFGGTPKNHQWTFIGSYTSSPGAGAIFVGNHTSSESSKDPSLLEMSYPASNYPVGTVGHIWYSVVDTWPTFRVTEK